MSMVLCVASYSYVFFQGQKWIKTVRKCQMEKILPYYKGSHDCDTIKRIAFDSHADCYVNSVEGSCDMVLNPQNWNALLALYGPSDITGADRAEAKKQVTV